MYEALFRLYSGIITEGVPQGMRSSCVHTCRSPSCHTRNVCHAPPPPLLLPSVMPPPPPRSPPGPVTNLLLSSPQTINGRAAQLGFVAGLASELQTGQTMVQQIASNPIAVPVVAGLVTLASLMPKLRGAQRYNVDPRSRSGGTWNARSELVNGRAAMLGLFLALVQEALTGTPLLG